MVRSGPVVTAVTSSATLLVGRTSPPPATIARVGYRCRGIIGHIHRNGHRRVARSPGQRVASGAIDRLARDRAGPARTAGGSGKESGRDRVDQGYGADRRRGADVGHGYGVGGAALPLGEITRVALGDRQVLAAVDLGRIRCGVIRGIDVSAPGNGRGVGYRCGRVGLNVHRECHRRITRCRGQSVGSSAGNGLEREAARPARAAGRHWNEARTGHCRSG